jgi:glycosyltransferase involved in cell wall biosynthesis
MQQSFRGGEMNPISVTILTKNREEHIRACLEGLEAFDEVVLLDSGSTDSTLEIASSFANVRIFKTDFTGFGPLKDLASSYAKNDWILNIDSDETVSEDLCAEVLSLNLQNDTVYKIPRENYYKGRVIKCCGWHPDSVLRLYNKQTTSFTNSLVHETLLIHDRLNVVKLKHSIKHFAFKNASEILFKMSLYSRLFASENKDKKVTSPLMAILHAAFSFIKSYFLRLGFLYGYEGLLISVSNATSTFYKYICLYEANRYS